MLPSDPPAPVASAPEYKLAPTANATLAPLTADERTMRGRWGVNIDGILKIAKEKPEELGLPAGALKEEITKQMLLTLPFFKSITLELNDDRGAVFVCAGTLLEETWHIDAGHVALDGLAELNELSLQREENQAAFGSPGMNSRGVPAKLMPRGVAITSAKLAGEWTVDIDASVKFTGLLAGCVCDHARGSERETRVVFSGLPQKLEAAGMRLRFGGAKATLITQGLKPKEATVAIMGDMVFLRAPGGLKKAAADAPELAAPMLTDGKMLAMNISSLVTVFARSPARQPDKPK